MTNFTEIDREEHDGTDADVIGGARVPNRAGDGTRDGSPDEKVPPSASAAFDTLRPFLATHRWRIALVFISVLAVAGAGLLAPWFIRELVRVVRVTAETPDAIADAQRAVLGLAALLAGTYALRGAAST